MVEPVAWWTVIRESRLYTGDASVFVCECERAPSRWIPSVLKVWTSAQLNSIHLVVLSENAPRLEAFHGSKTTNSWSILVSFAIVSENAPRLEAFSGSKTLIITKDRQKELLSQWNHCCNYRCNRNSDSIYKQAVYIRRIKCIRVPLPRRTWSKLFKQTTY